MVIIMYIQVNGSDKGWIKQYPKIDDDIDALGDILEEEEEEEDDEGEEEMGAFRIVPTPTDDRSESGESTSLLFADEADSNV